MAISFYQMPSEVVMSQIKLYHGYCSDTRCYNHHFNWAVIAAKDDDDARKASCELCGKPMVVRHTREALQQAYERPHPNAR